MSPIIQPAELTRLYKSEDLVLVDASSGKDAKTNYEKKHLEGARYVDLNAQLADIKENASMGGRHPLPTLQQFSDTLTSLGITPDSHVVIYDDKNGSNAAARFWWMLKSVGHKKVQVLNGGLPEAEKAGYPVSSKKETHEKTEPYKVSGWNLPQADIKEVERVSQDKNHLVIDVRDTNRYLGLSEPIDPVAGHIPGAVNFPFSTNLDEEGLFKSPGELREIYETVFGNIRPDHIIVHCGSGVTACHTLLAIDYAGLQIPKLYVGSWSEWSANHKAIEKNKPD